MASIVITGAQVWDGVSDAPEAAQVLVVDDRITAVGDTVEVPTDAQMVDLSGHTLTPGFMDCHTHVTITPAIAASALVSSSAQNALAALPRLRALLDNGFTTVRDLCCTDVEPTTIYLRDAIAAGLIEGPRMLVAPHLISARGGHGDFSGHRHQRHRSRRLRHERRDYPQTTRHTRRGDTPAGGLGSPARGGDRIPVTLDADAAGSDR